MNQRLHGGPEEKPAALQCRRAHGRCRPTRLSSSVGTGSAMTFLFRPFLCPLYDSACAYEVSCPQDVKLQDSEPEDRRCLGRMSVLTRQSAAMTSGGTPDCRRSQGLQASKHLSKVLVVICGRLGPMGTTGSRKSQRNCA